MRSRTRSLACKMIESTRASHHRFTEQSGVSCAMVLTAYSALSPVNGVFCHRRLQVTTCKLDPSVAGTGPHDFAVRVGIARLAMPSASIASCTNVRDDRDAPLLSGQDARISAGDLPDGAGEIFVSGD
jgi:hypothetical protein